MALAAIMPSPLIVSCVFQKCSSSLKAVLPKVWSVAWDTTLAHRLFVMASGRIRTELESEHSESFIAM